MLILRLYNASKNKQKSTIPPNPLKAISLPFAPILNKGRYDISENGGIPYTMLHDKNIIEDHSRTNLFFKFLNANINPAVKTPAPVYPPAISWKLVVAKGL